MDGELHDLEALYAGLMDLKLLLEFEIGHYLLGLSARIAPLATSFRCCPYTDLP